MSFRKGFFSTCLLVALVALASCSGQSDPFSLASESLVPDFLSAAPPRVHEAYRFAIANPDALETVPCFCGCGAMGHTSNLDCYIKDVDVAGNITFDNHAAGCGICVDITQDVMRLTKEGRTPSEIRAYIDATYGSFGPSTNTPLLLG